MLLAQSRHWRAELVKDAVALVPFDLPELRDLRIEVPLARWNTAVKHVQSDRKLLGGLLLDHARHKDLVAIAVGRDRLWLELTRVVLEATAALVAAGHLVLEPPAKGTP
jgi:hypothetical protein